MDNSFGFSAIVAVFLIASLILWIRDQIRDRIFEKRMADELVNTLLNQHTEGVWPPPPKRGN